MAKIKWEVSPAPTGRYRSFQKRGWPTGMIGEKVIAYFDCEDDYRPADVKIGNHKEITILFADRRGKNVGFVWRRLKVKAATLKEAKEIAQKFYADHPEVFEND